MTAQTATTPLVSFDDVKSEAFSERMVAILNGGAMALTISLGHRAGLFDAMAELPPSSSAQIAVAAGLNERYVREWLGAMVTGGIVEVDGANNSYQLPAEHAAWLTRNAAPDNLAVFTQYIPLLGQVEDEILECFKHGGGVPYERYPRFHEVMAEDSGQTVVAALFEHILPLVPGLTEQLERGISVLDVGCGSGRAMLLMAKHFPNSCFTGYDFSAQAIAGAAEEARRQGLENVVFEVRDAAGISEHEEFDLITTFDAVHDQKEPATVLDAVQRALKPEGVYLMQDIAGSSHVHNNCEHPIGPLLYTISCMHCMSVSLAQGGEGLGAMWGEELALTMLHAAGFKNVRVEKLAHDIQNSYYIVRKQ